MNRSPSVLPNDRRESKLRSLSVRRLAVGILSLVFLVVAASLYFAGGGQGSAHAGLAVCGRLGLMLAALWLAWPSLRRPANWLPPGVPLLGVIAIALVAIRPRLILMALPIMAMLTAIAAAMRLFRGSGR